MLSTLLGVQALRDQLHDTLGLVRGVLAQTRARVLKGDTHHPDKLLSLFEPEPEAIRKGKAAKPTEFDKVVKIQEAEAGLVTDYEVCPTRVPDQELWGPTLSKHKELFGRAPKLAVADGGFAWKDNERTATELGVEQVALPGLRRCRYRGPRGMERWVGLGVIANNLRLLGRAGPGARPSKVKR